MTFDSNRAWKEAVAAVAANREVLLALAGVFFVLPSIAFSLFFPQPEPPAGATPEQTLALMREFYLGAAPYFIPIGLVQMGGTLAMLTLFTDRSRPTVSVAIKQGFIAVIPYFLAQLMLGLGIGLAAVVLLALAGLTGVTAIVVLAGIALAVIVVYAAVKTSLVAPVVAVEYERNPVAALRRSWALTKGNSVRLVLFYLLVVVAFVIVVSIAMGIVGVALALLVGGETARIIAAVVSAVLGGVFSVYFVAILASVHRQLAGPSTAAVSATFE